MVVVVVRWQDGEVFTLPHLFRAESVRSPRTVLGQSELSEDSPRTVRGQLGHEDCLRTESVD